MWRCPETNGYVLGFPVLAGRLYICPWLGSAEAAVYPPLPPAPSCFSFHGNKTEQDFVCSLINNLKINNFKMRVKFFFFLFYLRKAGFDLWAYMNLLPEMFIQVRDNTHVIYFYGGCADCSFKSKLQDIKIICCTFFNVSFYICTSLPVQFRKTCKYFSCSPVLQHKLTCN